MSLEYKNGRPYYYRKKKIAGKVVAEYIGKGELALISAELDAYEKRAQKRKQELILAERAKMCQDDTHLMELETKLNDLFSLSAILNGWTKQKREWKILRNKPKN